MRKDIIVPVLVLVALVAVGLLVKQLVAKERGRAAAERSRRQWAEAQYSQEIICDACGASTTGLVLNRAQAGNFQVCPKCGQKAGRPQIYYMCQNPDCNRQLIKVGNTVWTDEGQSPGGPIRCPNCGRADTNITPLFLDLESAQKFADETKQEFP